MDAITGSHWMYEWLDEFEITDEKTLRVRQTQKDAKGGLFQLLCHPSRFNPAIVPSSGAVVAGLGLDLSSLATCSNFQCRAATANSEYSQVLHYFDCVVMEGPSSARYASHVVNSKSRQDVEDFDVALYNDALLMLYLRKIGLANYIVFSKRADCFCPEHLQQHIQELQVEEYIAPKNLSDIANKLSRDGSVFVEQVGPRRWYGGLSRPLFVDTRGTFYNRKTRPKKADVALHLIQEQLEWMIFDMSTSRLLGCPLASLGTSNFFAERTAHDGPLTVGDIALRVRIPALQGLSTEEFLQLRELEYVHFERFRLILEEAIVETINEAQTESPDMAGEAVWAKKIRPQVTDLENRIRASNRALTRKLMAGASVAGVAAAVGSGVGAVAAAVGGLAGAMIGGAAGVTSLLPAAWPVINKTIEEKQAFETAGSYFLWKAARAAGHA